MFFYFVKALLKQPEVKGSKAVHNIAKKIVGQNELAIASVLETLGTEKAKVDEALFTDLAKELLAEKSVVLAGGISTESEDSTLLQLVAIVANQLIGSYGEALQFEKGWVNNPVGESSIKKFIADAADLDVVFVIDTDPAFTVPASWGIKEALGKVGTVVSVQNFPRVTDKFADYALPAHHYLESWGDREPVAGFLSIMQPAVRPLKDSRQAEEVLMWVAAAAEKPLDMPITEVS